MGKKSTLSEFKEFILRGNVLDMAVGIIVGTAFNKIVNSLVNDIIMPPIGYLLGKVNFTELKADIGNGVTINYGNFIQEIINFLIVALTVFIIIKTVVKMGKLRKGENTEENKVEEKK